MIDVVEAIQKEKAGKYEAQKQALLSAGRSDLITALESCVDCGVKQKSFDAGTMAGEKASAFGRLLMRQDGTRMVENVYLLSDGAFYARTSYELAARLSGQFERALYRAPSEQYRKVEEERIKAEEAQKRMVEEMAEEKRFKAEKERYRVRSVQAQRRKEAQCILCGNPLSRFQRFFGKDKHGNCTSFKEPKSTTLSATPSPACSVNVSDRTAVSSSVEVEKQYALTLTVSELQQIANGCDVRTAVGYNRTIPVSKDVARKAIPVVQMIMDGDSLVSQNNLDGALQKYQAAIACEPKCAIAHMAIGTVYYRKADYASALKWTRKAAELDPLNSRIKDNLDCAEANFKDAFSGEMVERSKKSEAMLIAGIVRHVEAKTLPSRIPGVLGGTGKDTYEVYETNGVSEAREFLAGLSVPEQQKYIVVETPDGPVGRDTNGLYNPSKNWRGDDWNKF